jgi:hypothetical protein
MPPAPDGAKVNRQTNSAPFSMSDDTPKTTELSGGHGLRTGLSTKDIKQAFLDNLFYLMDRSIRDYCERVWKVTPSRVHVK